MLPIVRASKNEDVCAVASKINRELELRFVLHEERNGGEESNQISQIKERSSETVWKVWQCILNQQTT
jgi:hypothetical protein